MGNSMTDAELNDLVMAHLTGTASTEQKVRLDALLAANQEHIARYIRHVRESAVLHSALASERSPEVYTSASGVRIERLGTVDDQNNLVGDSSKPSNLRAPLRSLHPGLWWGMVTAAIVVAVVASQSWKNHSNHTEVAQSPSDRSPAGGAVADRGAVRRADDVVAQIIRKVDCIWEYEKWNVDSTSALARGQTLRISQGVMEIEFDCGAQVALEGPARFTIAGPKNGLLHSGSLTAVVPKQARGFSIKAPTTNVVDLGTSFSLRVREDGNTEIHVIDGEVLSQPVNPGGTSARAETKLLEHDSLLVYMDRDEPIAFEDSSRLLRKGDRSVARPALWDISLAKQLVLWLAADGDVEQDSRGGVRRWGDRLYGGNTHSESAWQLDEKHRPLWVPVAIGGKPALRFDGDTSYFVTDSLATADEQTVLLVVSPRPWRSGVHPKGWGFVSRQILNHNGPPNLAIQFNKGNRFSAWNFVGSEAQMLKRAGEFKTESLAANEAYLIRYTYSLERQFAELAINGQSQGKVPVTDPAAIDSPKYIGCHWGVYQHFDGDLAELLIFNEALSDDAAAEVSGYLAEKYGVPFESSIE